MNKCLICAHKNLKIILKYESYPLHIGVVQKTGKEMKYPLEIGYCSFCSNIQQMNWPQDKLLRKMYEEKYCCLPSPAVSGVAAGPANSFYDFYKKCNLNRKMKVLEIGCFDGYFLSLLKKDGWNVTGCEPSYACKIAKEKYNIRIINKYFSYKSIKNSKYDIVIVRNVLEHITDINRFLNDIYRVLTARGFIMLEVPNVIELLNNGVLGTFFHQHISYFSPYSLKYLLRNNSFSPVLTGAPNYTYYVCAQKNNQSNSRGPVKDRLKNEIKKFIKENIRLKTGLNKLMDKSDNFGIFGAGGHTTGLLMQLTGENSNKIKYIYDNDELKHNKIISDLNLKVKKTSNLIKDKPNNIIISSYLYQKELAEQLLNMRSNAKIIILYPEIKIIN